MLLEKLLKNVPTTDYTVELLDVNLLMLKLQECILLRRHSTIYDRKLVSHHHKHKILVPSPLQCLMSIDC